jgi:copper chaperone
MEKTVLKVEGMSCEHCVRAVNNALGGLSGVKNVNIDLKGASVSFEYDPALTPLDTVKKAITEEGYTVAD